jgi:hypothetical protein
MIMNLMNISPQPMLIQVSASRNLVVNDGINVYKHSPTKM